ncbi:MAG: CapA family protein [Lachnospiraceae bacterium]|nr:CapA family protein [Lachnospiraceae bacterium]
MTTKTTSLVFTGDIGFDKYMKDKWSDPALLSSDVASFLKSGSHLIVNVEGPLYDGAYEKKENSVAALLHSMDPNVRHFLAGIGADIWNICNNHIMDAGENGIRSTLEYAKECNATAFGAGLDIAGASSPVILNEAGGIGMIGVGYQRACRKAGDDHAGCFSWSDLDLIRKQIDSIKKTCRYCIISAHAGEEFTALPSPYTRDRYISYLDMGADIVIAHHPHVVNNYELFDNKAIFYSLGNFIFDTDYQRSQFGTEYGILLKLNFTEETFTFEHMGIKVDRTSEHIISCPAPAIFTHVDEKEYKLLRSLAAKVLIENTKKQLRYLKPDEYGSATEDDFVKNFYEPLRSGRVPGETLDMQIIYPLSLEVTRQDWRSSRLPDVVEYCLAQIDPASLSQQPPS